MLLWMKNSAKVEQVLASQYNDVMYDNRTPVLAVIGSFKSRGIGDCWIRKEAAWNGKIFIRTSEWTTGSCKGFYWWSVAVADFCERY